MNDFKHNSVPACETSCSFELTAAKDGARVDTRLLARHLGNQHKGVMALIDRYADKFQHFEQLLFKKEVVSGHNGGGNAERFSLLTEDQAFFLLSLSRNSERVVNLKVRLVQAFREARMVVEQRREEYLPTYHQLHDVIGSLAGESANEKFVHMNVNKLVNRVAGIATGQRATLALSQQSLLIVAQGLAAKVLRGSPDHHTGYERVKTSLNALTALTQLERQL